MNKKMLIGLTLCIMMLLLPCSFASAAKSSYFKLDCLETQSGTETILEYKTPYVVHEKEDLIYIINVENDGENPLEFSVLTEYKTIRLLTLEKTLQPGEWERIHFHVSSDFNIIIKKNGKGDIKLYRVLPTKHNQ